MENSQLPSAAFIPFPLELLKWYTSGDVRGKEVLQFVDSSLVEKTLYKGVRLLQQFFEG